MALGAEENDHREDIVKMTHLEVVLVHRHWDGDAEAEDSRYAVARQLDIQGHADNENSNDNFILSQNVLPAHENARDYVNECAEKAAVLVLVKEHTHSVHLFIVFIDKAFGRLS